MGPPFSFKRNCLGFDTEASRVIHAPTFKAMGANRRAFDIRGLLDKRSYPVYRRRKKEQKSFREIGEALGQSHNRVHQIYQASIQRIELKRRGGDIWPECSLSLRAIHCIYRAFGKTNVTKNAVIPALKNGKLRPGKVHWVFRTKPAGRFGAFLRPFE